MSSMCLDIKRGSPTEIEFLNGAVVRWGLEVGIETPVNAVLSAAVRRMEELIGLR
jgi:2-dehydropantoate 2-reductase